MNLSTDLEVLEKRKIRCPYRDSNQAPPGYTDNATLAPIMDLCMTFLQYNKSRDLVRKKNINAHILTLFEIPPDTCYLHSVCKREVSAYTQ